MYTDLFQSIFCNHEVSVNVRWLAVMYIKNGVDRYWRRTAPQWVYLYFMCICW